MIEYHKIQTVYKRDPSTNYKTLLEGEWSLPEFEYLSNNIWTFTEKVDGTNIRVILENGLIKYGGRTDSAQIPTDLLTKLIEIFTPLTDPLQSMFGQNVCLYGEGYGGKIQKGQKYKKEPDFTLFDVKVGQWWLTRNDLEDIANKLNLQVVPVIGYGTLFDAINIVKQGLKSQWGDFEAEGIVAKPNVQLFSRNGERVVTKIKCRDFKHDC